MSDDELEAEGDLDAMRAFMPNSFGKKAETLDVASQIEKTRRVPLKTPVEKRTEKASREADNDDDDDDDENYDDDDDDDDDDGGDFPVTHEITFKTHERPVTTISLDPGGGRLATGSTDGTIRLHDFSSMAPNTLRAFRTVDPWQAKPTAGNAESHPVHHVAFAPTSGGAMLCITAQPQAKILSRDGDVLTDFVKGDMYLRDMHNTKGHISEITSGTWHPDDRNVCLTAGTDSTLRIWDVNNKRRQRDIMVFKSKAPGAAGRTRMTAVEWRGDAIVSAAYDGSLVMWPTKGPFNRPAGEISAAHKAGTWTGGLDISTDGRMVVTRGGDDTVKLWDMRKFTRAVVTVQHPSTSDHFPTSSIRYSPTSSAIITGSPTGHLHILNPGNLRAEYVGEVTPSSALVTALWHPKLNQIVTGSANGQTHVLFHPEKSSRGALEILSKAPKRRHVDDDASRTVDASVGVSADGIIAPGAVWPPGTGRKRATGKKDGQRPQNAQRTPFGRSQPDEKHVETNIPLSRMLHEDPREALLKYAEVAKQDPLFTKAWGETQPVTQYAELSDDENDDDHHRNHHHHHKSKDDGPDKKRVKR